MSRHRNTLCLAAGLSAAFAVPALAQPGEIQSIDHYVDTTSISPAIKGEAVKLYVHERVEGSVLNAGRKSTNGKVVLFVHGGTYPTVPDFDLPYKDYSWMAYLAKAGFDTFSVDMTGYGKSSRPHMDDPCNVAPSQQMLIGKSCKPTFPHVLTSSESDWADVDAAVDYVRKLTGSAKIDLVGWSGGGPRVGGYTALHGDKVNRVVFLAPGYGRGGPDTAPPEPADAAPTAIATRDMAMKRWDNGVKCDDQYDPAIRDAIWNSNLQNDPLAAAWGPGVVRHPYISSYGWNQKLASKFAAPVLMVTGEYDVEVLPERVHNFYDDIASKEKVLINVACGSHYIVYERQYKVLHEASKEWFLTGKYHGTTIGQFNADKTGKIAELPQP